MSESQDTYPIYAAEGESESLDEFLESIDGLSLMGELEHLTLEEDEDDEDDEDEEEMPKLRKLREMVLVCVKDYNSSSQEGANFEFVRIEKAERFQACGGYIYSLTLRVKNNQGEQGTIDKMVWQGQLFEALHVEEKKKKKSESHDQTQLTVYLQEKLGSAVAMGHSVYLHLNRLISANANSNSKYHSGRITHGEGYIKFSNYDVAAVAKGHSDKYEVLVQGVVRRSKWVLPLNKDITNSLLSWGRITTTMGDPPVILPYGSPDIRKYKDPQYLNELDLTSPQILTQALFSLENYNLNKGSNLEFSKVERASKNRTMGIDYKLFISVKVGQSYQIFRTEVWEFAATSFWKCISPFERIQGTLGPLEQVDHPRIDM